MAAGSGGIRYNDSVKKIQIMDTYKNWVDWKDYDPNIGFQYVQESYSGTFSWVFQMSGLYILTGQGREMSNLTNPTTDASTKVVYNNGYGGVVCINAKTDDRISFNFGLTGDPVCVLFYIGNQFSDINLSRATWADGNTPTYEMSGLNKVLLGVAAGGQRRITSSGQTTASYQTSGRYSIYASIGESGEASMQVYGYSYGHAMVAEMQLL